jgi:tetratricopeptide (TPR) repeat protein
MFRCMPQTLLRLLLAHLLVSSSLLALAPLAAPAAPAAESAEPGAIALQQGQFEQAVRYGQAARAAAAESGDPAQQLDALLQLADAYQALGQYRKALATLRTAQPLADTFDDPVRRAAVLGALGKTLWLTGATDDAYRQLDSSVALARQAHAPQIAAASLNHLGNLAAEQGDARVARIAYQDSLTLARQTQDPSLTVTVLINAARLAAKEHDPHIAETLLTEAAGLMQTLPASHDKAYHLIAIGQLRRSLPGAAAPQRPQAAQDDFTAAATLARQLNDQRSLSYALGYQAQWQQDRSRPAEALALYRQAVFAAQQADAPELLYRWQWQIGRLLKTQGDRDGAILAYQQTVAHLQAIRQDFTSSRSAGAGSFRASVGDVFTELADLLLQRAAQQSAPSVRELDLLAARDTMELLKTAEVKDYFQDECVTALQSRITTLDRPLPHTAVIYPILLPDRLELLLQSPQGIQQITVRGRSPHSSPPPCASSGAIWKSAPAASISRQHNSCTAG